MGLGLPWQGGWVTLPLLGGFALWSVAGDRLDQPAWFYGGAILAFGGYLLALRRSAAAGLTLAGVIFVAVTLRLLALSLPLALSDDVYRYLWDGRVVAAGLDPYRLEPDSATLASLRDPTDDPTWNSIWQAADHRDVASVYPPFALASFSIASRFERPILAWKGLVAAFDLVGCLAFLWVVRSVSGGDGLGAEATPSLLAYVWNPLLVLEGAGMGHVDVVGVALLVAALWMLVRSTAQGFRRGSPTLELGSALALSLAILAKLVPLWLVPIWNARGRPASVAIWATVSALVALPLAWLWGARGVPSGLVTYGVSWEFNGPLFEPLWRVFEFLRFDTLVKAALDGVKWLTGAHELLNPLYSFVYPQLLAKVVLATAFALVLLRAVARVRSAGDDAPARFLLRCREVLGTFLLCSATLYPWYWVWLLPFAALTRSWAWLVLSGSLLMAYLPRLTETEYGPATYLGVWLPFFVAWAVERRVAQTADSRVSA